MSFAARRTAKPRKIAVGTSDSDSDTPPQLKTLPLRKKAPTPDARPKKKAAAAAATVSRLSFGGDPTDADTSEPAFTPKKSALSRRATERNAAKKKTLGGLERLSLATEERVSYSKEYLEELKSAQLVATPTPPTPEDVVMVDLDGDDDVDMAEAAAAAAAAGPSTVSQIQTKTQIMDEGLIRVMKERRRERGAAAKAGVKDFISLYSDASDEGGNELMLRPKKKKESRLVRSEDFNDDEEIANYVDDAERVLLTNSKSARREQERRRKQAIRETIAEAEGADDEGAESDMSRDSLAEEWERDQIRKGAFTNREHAARGVEGELELLARNPPAAIALPDIGDVVARLENTLRALGIRKAQTEWQVEALVREKREIHEREEMVQARLKEAAVQYERLRKETGIGGAGPEGVVHRGLESFGNTPIRVAEEE